jgi:hypothetical protein
MSDLPARPSDVENSICRWGSRAALLTLAGILGSGPLAVAWVNATHPQPAWQGPAAFARAYHPLQNLPYLGGIFLVAGFSALLVSVQALAPAGDRARTTLALVCSSVFASLVCLNYSLQTSYVPVLAREYVPGDAPLVSALSMANPKSLAWGLEMWGWGFSGLATWLLAPVFGGSRLEHATRAAFVGNGAVSIAGTAWTLIEPGWVMTRAGLIAFALWNLLLAALSLLAWAALRKRAAFRGR